MGWQNAAGGTFREDLFDRLATLSITLPPLRERRSDIPHIADRLLTQINRQFEQGEPDDTNKSLSGNRSKSAMSLDLMAFSNRRCACVD